MTNEIRSSKRELILARPILFLDYDGALLPRHISHSLAVLPTERRSLLSELDLTIQVVVVSGRSLASIREHVGISGFGYIGNYGLEMQLGGQQWVHPDALTCSTVLDSLKTELDVLIKSFPGVWLEDKKITITVHFQMTACGDKKEVLKLITQMMSRYDKQFEICDDKMAIEIRPKLEWSKEKAVEQMLLWLNRTPDTVVLYAGDDDSIMGALRVFNPVPDATAFVVEENISNSDGMSSLSVGSVWDFISGLNSELKRIRGIKIDVDHTSNWK